MLYITSTYFISQMTSVERVLEYSKLPSEASLQTAEDNKMDQSWPKYGEITAENLCLKYEGSDNLSLDNITFSINAGEKVLNYVIYEIVTNIYI